MLQQNYEWWKKSTLRNEECRASMEDGWTLVNGNHNCSFYDVKHLTKERDVSHSFRFKRQVWSYSGISLPRPHWGEGKVAAVERSLLFSTYLKKLTINPLTRTQSSGPHLSRGATFWGIPHLRRWCIKWLVPLITFNNSNLTNFICKCN